MSDYQIVKRTKCLFDSLKQRTHSCSEAAQMMTKSLTAKRLSIILTTQIDENKLFIFHYLYFGYVFITDTGINSQGLITW